MLSRFYQIWSLGKWPNVVDLDDLYLSHDVWMIKQKGKMMRK